MEVWGWIRAQGWSQHYWLPQKAAGAWAWGIQAGYRQRICFSSLDFLQIWSIFLIINKIHFNFIIISSSVHRAVESRRTIRYEPRVKVSFRYFTLRAEGRR